MPSRIHLTWLLFVAISGFAEAIFALFAGNYFQGSSQTLTMIFPQLQNTSAEVSRALGPFIANSVPILTIWTLTSMAISLEIVFVPLLVPGKNNFSPMSK